MVRFNAFHWLISRNKLFIFSYDSLTIHDGGFNTSPMLANPYCGDSLPPSQISSRNHLFIHFHSNYFNNGAGFKLEYNATSKNPYKLVHFVSRAKKKDMKIEKIFLGYSLIKITLLNSTLFQKQYFFSANRAIRCECI